MRPRSPPEIAREVLTESAVGSNPPAFAALRELRRRLESACGAADEQSVAAGLLCDFLDRILGDFLGAVPWDDAGTLKRAREKVLEAGRNAAKSLADFSPAPGALGQFAVQLAKAKTEYQDAVDEINAADRSQLRMIREGHNG